MRKPALLASFALHVAGILLLLLIAAVVPAVRVPLSNSLHILEPLRAPRLRLRTPLPDDGGGGGASQLPASRGRAPQPVPHKMFIPPMVAINNHPLLTVQTALLQPTELNISDLAIGDPSSSSLIPSNGSGPGLLGIGTVAGPGIGDRLGGAGVGERKSPAPRITRAPELLHKEEPEYSEEARKARFQGVVVLAVDIGLDGKPTNIRVVRGAGLGLDERAIEAVRRWLFRPALSGSRPTVAPALVEVAFHLL